MQTELLENCGCIWQGPTGAMYKIVCQKLPPIERAASFHSQRVHLQVIIWKTLSNHHLDPKLWGWKEKGDKLTPKMTDPPAASGSLLKFIWCNCKSSSSKPCGTTICSCRKHGLKCVTASGDCHGEICRNINDASDNFNMDEDFNDPESNNL